ncbi:uncharacterized protein LOC108215699 isoform X1 [Daucus carota subsp. sativus]|uniref:uncharacterized protein LOC108215699 isoform X1 n=1 Tax=Daucus carota subsp. sativus TaxID=79200 RepID=UPI0007EF2B48|nr:PREDICTED: uncharacterized protein LOC108215699 [Daucus carota subsp. sativus]
MGHRHEVNTSQMFETDSNHGWQYTDDSYAHFALAGGTANESLLHPAENMLTDNPNFFPPWIPSSGLDRYHPSSHTVEGPSHQPTSFGPSRDPYPHSFASGSFFMVSENHGHHTSNHSGQMFHEGGSTSSYGVSSFDLSVSSELRRDKPNVELHHTPWDNFTFRPICTGNSVTTSDEDSFTNVRSGADLVLGTSLARTHLSNNPSQHSMSSEQFGQNSATPATEWNQTIISTAPHDTTIFNRETNRYVMEGGYPSAPPHTGGYDIDLVAHRNTGTPVPQQRQGTLPQPVQGNQTSFTHQSIPAFRYARPSPDEGWHNSNQNGQTRFLSERRRPLSSEGGFYNRFAQGLALADQSRLYGSRTSLDQHRDMRLDVDEMSYEELLALGERIGSVNTGLSEDLIRMCVTQSIYCSSDITEEEGSCAICLEEYKNMDDVGMLKACLHNFHVGCIRKWLLLKNICPICKSSVVADRVKDK